MDRGGMKMNFAVQDVKAWLQKTNIKIQENKQYLTRLDQAIGDGDHGINMARGFQAVLDTINAQEYTSVSDILKDIAMTVMSNVGGAAGPLYGTIFFRSSLALKDKERVDYPEFVNGLKAGLAGLKQRGKSQVGEKTMIDVWEPVVSIMAETDEAQPTKMIETAKVALEKTAKTMATKGRAAYFKEKSIGHIDPGAASSYYLLSALADVLEGAK